MGRLIRLIQKLYKGLRGASKKLNKEKERLRKELDYVWQEGGLDPAWKKKFEQIAKRLDEIEKELKDLE